MESAPLFILSNRERLVIDILTSTFSKNLQNSTSYLSTKNSGVLIQAGKADILIYKCLF